MLSTSASRAAHGDANKNKVVERDDEGARKYLQSELFLFKASKRDTVLQQRLVGEMGEGMSSGPYGEINVAF